MLVTATVAVLAQDEPAGRLISSGPAAGTHDPTVIHVGDRYLRFASGHGIPIASSKDLVRWELAGQVFAANPEWTSSSVPGSGDLWAPDVVFRQGVWRIYYAVSTFGSNRSAIGWAINRHLDPERPDEGWVDQGPILESGPDDSFNAIDPQIAQDETGNDWLVYGSFWDGIFMNPLTDGTVAGSAVALARRPEPPDAIEGAYLFRHGAWYYLIVSFDFCCRGVASTYHLRMGRSADFRGPYVDRQGRKLLEGGGTVLLASEQRDRGPGHASVLQDGDTDWLVYHVYDARYGGASRLRIAPLVWDDGWPHVVQGPSVSD